MGGIASAETARFSYKGQYTTAKVKGSHFAEGTQRLVYHAKVRNTSDQLVVKVPKDGYLQKTWNIDLSTHKIVAGFCKDMIADFKSRDYWIQPMRMANHWSLRVDNPAQRKFMGMKMGDAGTLPKGYRLWGEELLDDFDKFNSNSGYCDNRYDTIQALSHYSWMRSRGSLVVCDLQGSYTAEVGYVISDPAINSIGMTHGSTDLGPLGLVSFMSEHQCNHICEQLSIDPKESMIQALDSLYSAVDVQLPVEEHSTFHFDVGLKDNQKLITKSVYQRLLAKINFSVPLFKVDC